MNSIEYKDISFSYDDDKNVLENISFQIKEGEAVGVIGANGAGKSTLLKLMLGIVEPIVGEIFIKDMIVKKANYTEIRKKVGYIFQDSDNQLFMNNVNDEISFALYNYGWKENQVKEAVDRVLEELDIISLKNRKIIKLSGGEKKLVSIASILVMNPEILLLDEPTNTLDPRYRRRVIDILNNIKCTKIIASHDLDMISKTCEKVLMIYKGKIIKIGKTEEILSNKQLLMENGLY